MKKIIVLLFIGFASCSETDEQFCKCLDASEKFDKVANDLLSGKTSETSPEERKALKKEKEKACENYQTMSGEEMLKRKADCE